MLAQFEMRNLQSSLCLTKSPKNVPTAGTASRFVPWMPSPAGKNVPASIRTSVPTAEPARTCVPPGPSKGFEGIGQTAYPHLIFAIPFSPKKRACGLEARGLRAKRIGGKGTWSGDPPPSAERGGPIGRPDFGELSRAAGRPYIGLTLSLRKEGLARPVPC